MPNSAASERISTILMTISANTRKRKRSFSDFVNIESAFWKSLTDLFVTHLPEYVLETVLFKAAEPDIILSQFSQT